MSPKRLGRGRPVGREWFGITTWNMHTRGVKDLMPHLAEIHAEHGAGATVFLLQEVFGAVPNLLKTNGFGVYLAAPEVLPKSPAGAPQTAVAWVKARHTMLWARTVPLNVTPWGPKGKLPTVIVYLALVSLQDLVTGEAVLFGSYHTAPRVQVPESIRPWRRFQSLREAAKVWRALSKEFPDGLFILGGDSNVDVDVLTGGPWGFLRYAATGFRIVDPEGGTHDGSAKAIDQFRVRGGVDNTEPEVFPVRASDHHKVRVWMRKKPRGAKRVRS